MNSEAGETIPFKKPKEEPVVIKKETDEHSDEYGIGLNRIKTEPSEDHWVETVANNKEASVEANNKLAVKTNNGEFEAAGVIEQLFIKNEDDPNIETMSILNSIKSEPSEVEWDNCEADKINVFGLDLENNGSESEMDVDSKVDISKTDSNRIKNENMESDNVEGCAESEQLKYQLATVKSETDMGTEESKVAEIAEEYIIKSGSELSMDAMPDIASTSLAKSKFLGSNIRSSTKKRTVNHLVAIIVIILRTLNMI